MKKLKIRFAACTASEHKPEVGSWFQTTPPFGEYPAGGTIEAPEGEEIGEDPVIIFDQAAVDAIVAEFNSHKGEEGWPGILVDREHFSLDYEKPSDAMAWALDIRVAEDGSIWTKWEFTKPGLAAWEDKQLVSRSPVLELDTEDNVHFHPVRLESIGMTNTPHFKDLSTLAAAKSAEVKQENNNKGEIQMDKDILSALGLAEGASKDDVLAAIKALKDGTTAAEAKATEAEDKLAKKEAECRKADCDKFLAENADKIGDADAIRAAFMENPEQVKKTFAAFKGSAAPKNPQQILAAAKKPTASDTPDVMKQLAACKSPAERAEFAVAHAKELAEVAKK